MSDTKRDEAAELRAQLKALADERGTKQAARASARELRELKQRLLDNTAIADAEDKLGEQGIYCGCVETPSKRVIIVKRAAYAKFREFQEKTKPTNTDMLELVETCRYYPDAETFDALIEEFPGLLLPLSTVVARLAGTLQEDAAKK